MEAYRSHKNRYLALVALALLFAATFVTVITASESDAAGRLTFDPSGGTITSDGRTVQNCRFYVTDNTYVLPEVNTPFEGSDGEEYVISRLGYSLTGWRSNGGNAQTYPPGTSVSVWGNTTYTAQWVENTVTLNPNGGTITGGRNPASLDITVRNTTTVPGTQVRVNNTNYTSSSASWIHL